MGVFNLPSGAGAKKHAETSGALMMLDVVAIDRHNQPVMDLTQDDFQVFDSGKRGRILFFRAPGEANHQLPPLGEHDRANRTAVALSPPVVVLLDLLNARFITRAAGWQQVIHSLQHLQSPDNVYVYVLTIHGVLRALHSLPVQGQEPAAEGAAWASHLEEVLNQAMKDSTGLRTGDEEDPTVRAKLTLAALHELTAGVNAIPGSKNVLWISHGFPLQLRLPGEQWVDYSQPLRELSEDLVRGHAAVYTVDQSALGVGGELDSQSTQTLHKLSDLTGGYAYVSDSTDAAVTDVIRDGSSRYEIGYVSEQDTGSGKYHKLRVAVDRQGVRVQTRAGYYGGPRAQNRVPRGFAAGRAFDEREIGLRALLSPTASGIQAQVRLDLTGVLLIPENHRYTAQVELGITGFTDEGPMELEPMTPLDIDLTEEQRATGLKNGFDLTREVSVKQSVHALRIVVFDTLSGAGGSVTIPLTAGGLP